MRPPPAAADAIRALLVRLLEVGTRTAASTPPIGPGSRRVMTGGPIRWLARNARGRRDRTGSSLACDHHLIVKSGPQGVKFFSTCTAFPSSSTRTAIPVSSQSGRMTATR